ncbi:amidase [Xylaria sp. FL0064]|nr:amidase [Xylaria sp. FL0064]
MESYRLTATQALSNIRNGSLTVEQYSRSLLSRIQERDSTVQAWEHLDPDHVISEARRLDRVPPRDHGPLHGLPIAVKDIIHTKDMPTQYNSPIYRGNAPQVDAAAIIILRRAGALMLGKTTTTEFASTQGGPKTCNPHDPTRTPGGSSSGSAAAVADFQAPIGLGSQTGGSMIRPDSFNGIYAFKPTWNAISREGLKLYSPTLDTIGFFARCVDDLELMADLFGLKDDEFLGDDEFTVRGAKFGVAKTVVWPQAGPGTTSALETAVQLLRSHGAEVEEIELPPKFDRLPEWHGILLHGEGRATFLPEYKLAQDKLSPFLAAHVENVNAISRAAQSEAYDEIAALRPKIDRIAKDYAAILTPSVIDEALVGTASTGSPAFNVMWTALHTPVVNIPGFGGASGLPIGISLVAPRYHDRHLLAVSKAVGAIFGSEGGWECRL